jgi:hypothetical protein
MAINNNLFDTLNWILKKNKKPQNKFESNFMLNRWLSMSNNQIAQIINSTGNRWIKVLKDFQISKFYYIILPKNNDRISYIKKKTKQENDKDYKIIAENMELSTKDIVFLENALEDLNNQSK